ITYDPPAFSIVTGNGKLQVAMPAALRKDARECWGGEVIVLVEGRMTRDGEVREPKALEIRSAARTDMDDVSLNETFGMFNDTWGTAEAQEYFESLRGKH